MNKLKQLLFFRLSNKMKRLEAFVIIFIHSALLALAWHSEHTAFLVFFAFIPVFYFLDYPQKKYNERVKLFIFSFLAVFFWIYLTIYWIKPINSLSHFFTTLLSSAILFIPYLLAYYFRFAKKKSSIMSNLIFILSWVIIELCHDINLLGFPYLNLSHILAAYPKIIQWYSLTGSIGGTIWIMTVNLSLYLLLSNFIPNRQFSVKNKYWNRFIYLPIIILPIITSFLYTKTKSSEVETTFNIVCVHTNVDVYDYKYDVKPEILLKDYLLLTKRHLDITKQNLIVWPENALTGNIFFTKPDSSPMIKKIKKYLCSNPNNILISGAIVDEVVDSPDSNSYHPNILYENEKNYFFKRYNTALFISSITSTLIKTKKRLVPFGEKIPSQKMFLPLVSLLPNLAKLNFSSREEEFPVFSFQDDKIRTNPIICYGSAFSDYVANEILKTRSNFIVVILNEGWMKSNKAYTHFNWFSICRAIENRRQLIKSSNEGISAIINSKGEIEKLVTGNNADVLESKLYISDSYSFFTRFHSVIHYSLLIIGMAFILIQLLYPKHFK